MKIREEKINDQVNEIVEIQGLPHENSGLAVWRFVVAYIKIRG